MKVPANYHYPVKGYRITTSKGRNQGNILFFIILVFRVEMFMQICDEALKWMAEKSNTLSDSIVDRDLEAIRTMQRKHQV